MGFAFIVFGAIVVVTGTIMVASGIPVREFSFGNTLIVAGTTAAVGGLIVVAIGAAIQQLRRIAEALQTRAPVLGRGNDLTEMLSGGGNRPMPPVAPPAPAARIPFPPKTKPEAERGFEPLPEPSADADIASRSPFAPIMREEPPVPSELDEMVPPAPPAPPPRLPNFMPPSAPPSSPPPFSAPPPMQPAPAAPPPFMPPPPRDGGWRPPMPKPVEPRAPEPKPAEPRTPDFSRTEPKPSEPPRGFDTMWSGSRAPKSPPMSSPMSPSLPPAAPVPASPPPMPRADLPKAELPPRTESVPRSEPHATPILKSGVVDGMGYTLYVDGSIEADLPQGTVRFASIADLRTHLEKNS